MMHYRNAWQFIMLLALAGVPAFTSLADAQSVLMHKPDPVYDPLDSKARAAKDNAGIRDLFQEIHDVTLFGPLPSSIAERLVTSQRNFIEKKQAPVTEAAVADAVNVLGHALDATTFTGTNAEQVRLLRVAMFLKLNALLASGTPPPPGKIVSNDLSPAGGVFLACLLLRQKLANPVWYGNPESQNREWLTRMTSPNASTQPALTFQEEAPGLKRLKLTLTNGLADEGSPVTRAFHQFLDVLQIKR